MKKIFLYLLCFTTILSSCSKKDDTHVFAQSADERLNAALAKYQSQLTGSQFGWKAVLTTDSGRGAPYGFYMKFTDSNRVRMVSDFDSTSAVTLKESSYRLKALQQPSLLFDTYTYIHVLADPNPNNNGGTVGAGLQSDFEFYFDSVTTDVIKLGGRFNGNKLVLTRATQQEANAYNSGQLAAGLYINNILTYFKRLTIGSQLVDVQITSNTHKITFTWVDANGNAQIFTTTYYLTAGGMVLTNPLVIGSLTIKSFDSFSWSATTQTLSFTTNGTASTIKGIVVPLKVDVGAPQRWYQYAVTNGNAYWISYNGFHVNGVDDAFGINSLISGANTYYYLIYWPKYAANNDFFGPVFLNAARTGLTIIYGTAPKVPTFTADGRAIFVQLGNYGTYPATGAAAQSRTLLYNSSGWYFVQTSATSYDMVNAADGKSWITWEF